MSVALALAVFVAAAPPIELRMGLGTQKILDVEGMQRFTVEPPTKAFEVKKIGERQLLFIGLAAGKGTVAVLKRGGAKVFILVIVQHVDLSQITATSDLARR